MTEPAQTPPASSPPPAQTLVDKKGRALRGAALKMAEIKKRDGKGPRPPRKGERRGDRHGDIAPSRSTAPKSSGGLLSRLARVW